jgi:CRP/FNR family transcriptional regulator, cyclic AMP receptor protein
LNLCGVLWRGAVNGKSNHPETGCFTAYFGINNSHNARQASSTSYNFNSNCKYVTMPIEAAATRTPQINRRAGPNIQLNVSANLDPAVQAFCEDSQHPVLLRELATQGDVRRYRKGSIIINEGDFGDTLFIILNGQVKSYSVDLNDKEITFGVFGAGEYIGEMALDGAPRSSSVITLQATACAVITRARLLAYIAQRPEFALEMLAKVIRRLRATTQNARNLAFIDVYGRLTQCLHGLAKPQVDGTQRVEERITHAEIASRAGCSREMVSRILKDLETGGYLRMDARRIVLLKKLPLRW